GASIAGLPVLLVNPGVALPTDAVFSAWSGEDGRPLARDSLLDAALAGRNDLETAACRIVPEIGAVLDSLRGIPGARLVRMSGSGATCFAIFEAERARDVPAGRRPARHPGWWRLATRLRA